VKPKKINGPSTYRFLKDLITQEPHVFLHQYMIKYGSITRLKLIKEIYVVNNHELAKEILKKVNKEVGKKNFIIDRMKKVFGNGIVTNEDDKWLQARRILMPSFHRQKVQTYLDDINSIKNEVFEKWKIQSPCEIELSPEIRVMILRMIMLTLTGSENDDLCKKILHLMEKGALLISNSMPFNTPKWIPCSSLTQLEKMNLELEKLIDELLESQHERILSNEAGMLSDLYYATDENGISIGKERMIDEIKSIILSGVFTTSDVIIWTISLIETHPEIKKSLLNRIFDSEAQDVIQNCIDESMRLYPPVWSIWYNTKTSFVVDQYKIPKDSVILINLYNIMRNPFVFEDPDQFKPNRFDAQDFPEESYIPYGFGARKCIGATLASFIIPNFLKSLYTDFDVRSNLSLPLKARVVITLNNAQNIKLSLRSQSDNQ
jgi:cytochrome P450